jgi:hypothetical protein
MFAYFAWARSAGQAALIGALALYGAGCGLDSDPAADDGSGGSSGSGAAGSAGTSVPAPTLTLRIPDSAGVPYTPRENDTVTRLPREMTEIGVFVSDGARAVRFALLPNDPAATSEDMLPGDAALDNTEIWTDENGEGKVTLTAPSRPSTFLLRGSIATLASQQIRFAVLGNETTSLEVVPLYDGRRSVERWTAKANPGRTCAEIIASPPENHEYENSSTGASVLIEAVPTGGPLAVSLRAEHYVWGCTDVANAVESGDPQRVEVAVTDVQIQLDESRVELELSLDSLDAWTDTLERPLPDVVTALAGGAADDVEALLDAMQDSLDDEHDTAFASKRGSDKWDTRVREALGEGAATVLREPFEGWLAAGLADLDGERAFRGVLAPSAEAAGSAELALAEVFGQEPKKAGFTVENRGSWMAVADVVLIGMTLDFNPHAFLVSAARASAIAGSEDAASTGEALAELLPCSLVATALQAPDHCGGDCESLCVDGLELLVANAAKAPLDLAKLRIAATGAAGVGADAEFDNLDGSWIGQLEYGTLLVSVGGDASARSE